MKIHRLLLPLLASFLASFSCSQGATLTVLEEHGPRSRRINMVFLSEGYQAAELPAFAAHVNNAINYLFSREPWQRYRSYCNVYRIEVASNQSGTDNGVNGDLRDTYFDTGFGNASVPQLLTVPASGQSKAYALLNQFVPEFDVPVVLVNDIKYGGSGGALSVASADLSSVQIVEHEVGHSFAHLADEYDANYPGYTPTESYNVTQASSRNLVRWKSWIDPTTDVPTPETILFENVVGVFEGGMYRTTGWFRPHYDSLMQHLGRPTGQVNREKFVLSYYEIVNPVDSFSPGTLQLNFSSSQMLTLALTPMSPSSGPPLTVRWLVDGVERPYSHETELTLFTAELGNGAHAITGEVSDPTAYVRDDPTGLLVRSVTWNIQLANQLPRTLASWRAAFGPDTANPSGDGLNNLIKYALGLAPNVAALPADRPSASVTQVSAAGRYLTLTIPRRWLRPEINYLPQSSGDLQTWNSGPGHTVILEDNNRLLKVRDAVSMSDSDRRFLGFSVQLK